MSLLGSDGLQRLRLLVALVLVMAMSLPDWRPGLAQDADPCPEPNDDIATACPLPEGVVIRSTLSQPSDRDVFRIVADAGVELIGVELFDLPADYDLYLSDARGRVLGQSVHEGTASEDLRIGAQTGTYYATVQADTSRIVDPAQPYSLRLTLVRKAGVSAEPTAVLVTSSANVPAPAPPPPAPPDSRRVLLADDFTDPIRASLPTVSSKPDVMEIGYVDGEYKIRKIDVSPRVRGVSTNGAYGDAAVAVDIRMVGDSVGRVIGVSCRWDFATAERDSQVHTAYSLLVYPDTAEFFLGRSDPRNLVTLIRRQKSPAINFGSEWNRIELACFGSTIVASANGIELTRIDDSNYMRGRFAFTIGGINNAPLPSEVRLDNLVIYGP